MRNRKPFIGAVLILLLALLCQLSVLAAQGQVFDQAGLFESSQNADLRERTDLLREQYNMNMVVVTTDDAQGKDAQDYGDDFYMDNGFYGNEEKGGAQFLIDMDNRKVWISTAGDMQYYLTDARVEDVIDAGYGEIKAGNYYQAVCRMLERTAQWIEEGIPADQYTYNEETGEIVRYRSITPMEAGIAAAIALAAAAAVCFGVAGRYQLKWGTYKYPYQEKCSLKLTRKNDRFTNQIVTTRHIPKSPPPSSGGGGGGGGTTVHTSSGGGSFGGGGRGF